MRRKTREELTALRQQIHDLTMMVYAIADAAGVAALHVPERPASTRWVRTDSEEWKAESARRQRELEGLRAMASAQAPFAQAPFAAPGPDWAPPFFR